MTQYRVLEKSLIGNEIKEEGEMCEYDGLPGSNLEPVDDEGRAKAAEYIESNKKRVALMIEQNPSGVGDPSAFMAALAKQIADSQANQAQMIGEAVAQALSAIFPNGVPVKGAVQLPA
jgi:hypothetical protein